jgi:hypothetical protein
MANLGGTRVALSRTLVIAAFLFTVADFDTGVALWHDPFLVEPRDISYKLRGKQVYVFYRILNSSMAGTRLLKKQPSHSPLAILAFNHYVERRRPIEDGRWAVSLHPSHINRELFRNATVISRIWVR